MASCSVKAQGQLYLYFTLLPFLYVHIFSSALCYPTSSILVLPLGTGTKFQTDTKNITLYETQTPT
jgi:hypothetical protein